jgi:hypothetical protein
MGQIACSRPLKYFERITLWAQDTREELSDLFICVRFFRDGRRTKGVYFSYRHYKAVKIRLYTTPVMTQQLAGYPYARQRDKIYNRYTRSTHVYVKCCQQSIYHQGAVCPPGVAERRKQRNCFFANVAIISADYYFSGKIQGYKVTAIKTVLL